MISSTSKELSSCLYEGTVTHHRREPFTHAFRYRLFQFFLDLDELDVVFRNRFFWSTSRIAPARFRREDHLGPVEVTLKEAVKLLVKRELGKELCGPIKLLTQLRYYGFAMNPVSFYYCYDATGKNVEVVVAEVNNTPWGEQHCYVLPWNAHDSDRTRLRIEKEFHVSPFLPMQMQYAWEIEKPCESFRLKIENYQDGELKFDAILAMKRQSITTRNLTSSLVRYPWMSMKTFGGIYWQALKLWWKGATYFSHPKNAGLTCQPDESSLERHRPHFYEKAVTQEEPTMTPPTRNEERRNSLT